MCRAKMYLSMAVIYLGVGNALGIIRKGRCRHLYFFHYFRVLCSPCDCILLTFHLAFSKGNSGIPRREVKCKLVPLASVAHFFAISIWL